MRIKDLLVARYAEKGIRAVVVEDKPGSFHVRFLGRESKTVDDLAELRQIANEVQQLVERDLEELARTQTGRP